MNKFSVSTIITFSISLSTVFAQDVSWTKELKDPKKRGTLNNGAQHVRGDSGKWSDKPLLFHAPIRPPKTTLDAWADFLLTKKPIGTGKSENWLVFRSKQLDDNDRVWIECIELRGKQITVVCNRAKWKGKYFRNFTYYKVIGINLGKLQPGKYEVKWMIKPMAFNKFDGDGKPRGNWPKDERKVKKKPTEMRLSFSVAGSAN